MTTLIPRRFHAVTQDEGSELSWLRRKVTSVLQDISRRACAHPIHTIVGVALLASTTYVGPLEGSIFDSFRISGNAPGQLDTSSFLYGSRSLRLGEQTSWRWQIEDATTPASPDVSMLFLFSMDCPS
jgi:hydroxymethylglutaryl-CoA reductase (NADPH)